MKKFLAIICLLILASSIFVLAGCKTAEPERQTPPALPPEIQETSEPTPMPTELLSGVRCVNGKIQGTVTNILDEQIDLSNARVFINGLLNRGVECDKMVLNPGESTFCTNMIGKFTASSKKANKLDLRIGSAIQVEIINC